MTRRVRVQGIRRKQIDEDKLALAFLLLAKAIANSEGDEKGTGDDEEISPGSGSDRDLGSEAA